MAQKKIAAKSSAVPDVVSLAVRDALNAFEKAHGRRYQFMREFLTAHVQQTRSRGQWYFDKDYRHEIDAAHSLIYSLISTVGANCETAEELDRFYGRRSGGER